MTWVAWRQFRTQALVAVGLLAAFAVPVLVTGLHLRRRLQRALRRPLQRAQ
jgi:hypothetical protein